MVGTIVSWAYDCSRSRFVSNDSRDCIYLYHFICSTVTTLSEYAALIALAVQAYIFQREKVKDLIEMQHVI
jgi:hypothetical protein